MSSRGSVTRARAMARVVMAERTFGAERFSDVNAATYPHHAAANMVPAPQITERNAKAICNGNERIAAPNGIETAVPRAARHGNDERLHAVERTVCAELIGCSKF